jgi:3-oxoacyl-(acyl-carrier-protein) synthase
MKMYIKSIGSISPQRTYGNHIFPADPIAYTGGRLKCLEPDYAQIIDGKSIRRMSRIIKMGVAAAVECLQESGNPAPDAIITGTAYGCLQDTESFLTKMVENREELLTPTSFIQSTHNTVGAQIALLLGCHQYNNTFVHRGFSFETALLDARMLLEENAAGNVLVGALDELTETSYLLLQRMGLYKQYPISNLELFPAKSKGTIAGEGAAFFLLSGLASAHDYAILEGLSTVYKPVHETEIETSILHFLDSHGLSSSDLDLVISGRNGDLKTDAIYDYLKRGVFSSVAEITYKQFCGEYPTSTAFALWLAAVLLKNKTPVLFTPTPGEMKKIPQRILIYNQYQQTHHAIFLISAC